MAAIQLNAIRKRFGRVQALDGVSLDVEPGEVHALLGENGAGKTTLMNVLYGLIRPDSGTIQLDGEPVVFRSPRDAIRAGIGMVHQHFMLVPDLTVAENLFLGDRERQPFRFRRSQALDEAARLAEEFGFEVDVRRMVEELPVGVQQRVEILKCLARRARLLILDEPTAVLTPQEVDELNEALRRLRDSGRSIIFISHKLKEVLAVCDRVTVLRSGRNVGTVRVGNVDEAALSEMMVGRTLVDHVERKPLSSGAPIVFQVEDLVVRDDRGFEAVKGVTFSVHAGEIVGIAGVEGNGQAEFVEALAGVRPVVRGSIRLRGEEMTGRSPRARSDRGFALITDDRHRKGLVLDFSVAENLVLKRYRETPFSRRGWLHLPTIRAFAEEKVHQFDVRTPSVDAPVETLSGGNQQKVVVAREMTHATTLLVAVNPTRGLDVGATEYVHDALLRAREDGRAILLISTELDEILKLSDRIGVLYSGALRELPPESADRMTIGRWMLGQGASP